MTMKDEEYKEALLADTFSESTETLTRSGWSADLNGNIYIDIKKSGNIIYRMSKFTN